MFQFPGFPAQRYGFTLRSMVLHHGGFPIRKSADRSLFAAPRSLSQLVTSFIGSWCQGIHLTLLFAWTSCIMYLTILWFSLNCLSFFELTFRIIDSCSHEKTFYSPFALVLSYSTLRWNCIFPFRLERHIIKIICPLLFVFYSNLSSIQLSKIFEPLGSGRSGWTRTIDLALIRRAL